MLIVINELFKMQFIICEVNFGIWYWSFQVSVGIRLRGCLADELTWFPLHDLAMEVETLSEVKNWDVICLFFFCILVWKMNKKLVIRKLTDLLCCENICAAIVIHSSLCCYQFLMLEDDNSRLPGYFSWTSYKSRI